MFLSATLLFTALGSAFACGNSTSNTIDAPSRIEANAEASTTIRIRATIERGNWCLNSGTGCTIRIDVTIDLPFLMNVNFDRLDASYDGKVMEGFEFESVENDRVTTYTVPTQVLRWNGDGFTMNYR